MIFFLNERHIDDNHWNFHFVHGTMYDDIGYVGNAYQSTALGAMHSSLGASRRKIG